MVSISSENNAAEHLSLNFVSCRQGNSMKKKNLRIRRFVFCLPTLVLAKNAVVLNGWEDEKFLNFWEVVEKKQRHENFLTRLIISI